MRKMLYVASIAAALADITNASTQAAAAKCGGVCIGPFRGGDSVLQYKHIGKVTIRQIYGEGFRIVHMQDDENAATYMILVIEEQ